MSKKLLLKTIKNLLIIGILLFIISMVIQNIQLAVIGSELELVQKQLQNDKPKTDYLISYYI